MREHSPAAVHWHGPHQAHAQRGAVPGQHAGRIRSWPTQMIHKNEAHTSATCSNKVATTGAGTSQHARTACKRRRAWRYCGPTTTPTPPPPTPLPKVQTPGTLGCGHLACVPEPPPVVHQLPTTRPACSREEAAVTTLLNTLALAVRVSLTSRVVGAASWAYSCREMEGGRRGARGAHGGWEEGGGDGGEGRGRPRVPTCEA
jgi:hypothetical protein